MLGRAFPYGVLSLAQLAVGAAAIFARFALHGAGPLAVAAGRLTIAAAILAVAALVRPERRTFRPPRDRLLFFFAGLALALHFASWIWSLQYTSIAISVLLAATTPVWTALYEAIVHRRSLGAPGYAAFAAGAAGLVLITGFNATPPPIPGHGALGALLAVVAAIAIGAYFLLVREVRADYGTRAIVTRTYAWASVALIAAALAAHQPPPPLGARVAWSGIVAMALVSQLLGHTALNAALRWFSPSAIGVTILIEPVVAAALAFAIFGEGLRPAAFAGGALILLAIGAFLRYEPSAAPA